jgi:hypothetical protein
LGYSYLYEGYVLEMTQPPFYVAIGRWVCPLLEKVSQATVGEALLEVRRALREGMMEMLEDHPADLSVLLVIQAWVDRMPRKAIL